MIRRQHQRRLSEFTRNQQDYPILNEFPQFFLRFLQFEAPKNPDIMYETSSCSYQSALDVKRATSSPLSSIIKTEEFAFAQNPTDWTSYRFHQSTFEQLKQSVEKAKAALQDRTFLGSTSAFSDLYSTQRISDTPENISSNTLGNVHNNNNNISLIASNINPSSLTNGANNSSQANAVNHNHSHNSGVSNQRINASSHLTTQPHETNLETTKPRQQSE
jgi:hypothetical protein